MSSRLRSVFVLCLLGALTACSDEPSSPARFENIRFANRAAIGLAVDRVETRSDFQPTFKPPYVEHQFPVPPQRALENWAHDRLQAIGGNSGYIARFTITDASVRGLDLPRTGGVAGLFTTDQTQRYDGHEAVRLEIVDPHGTPVRTAVAESADSRTVPEGVTLNQRDRVWYEMSVQMTNDLDAQLQQEIDQNFSPYRQ